MSVTTPAILDPARAADPRAYVLGGREPVRALRPTSALEVAETLRAATRDRLALVPWGGGTGIDRERAPARYDLALDLSQLARMVEYDPEDLTLTAECGVSLALLRSTLAAHRQELPLEAPDAVRATLGGVLARNASGPRRLRFGAPRDRILGARIALADGTIVRSGGKVVKNVAGYALHRLLCGSRGGLALLLEASLKLPPAPEARVVQMFGVPAAGIADRSRWSFLPRIEPAFLTVLGAEAARHLPPAARTPAPFTVAIGLEDDAAWVAELERRIEAEIGPPAARLEGEAAIALAQALADAGAGARPRLEFTSAHNTPDALAPLLGEPEAAHLVYHAPAGRLHWRAAGADETARVRDLSRRGFTLIGTTGAVTAAPAVPPETAVLDLRERIRGALDPAGVLVLGGPGPT